MSGQTNGRRNKAAGKGWELDIIKILKNRHLYPLAVSTRSESRSLDNSGIDIMNRNEGKVGLMKDSIQAKCEVRTVPYPKLLDRIREAGRSNPVVFHRQTAKTGKRFMVRDEFAICYLDTYLDMIANRHAVDQIKSELETLPCELQQRIQAILQKLGL